MSLEAKEITETTAEQRKTYAAAILNLELEDNATDEQVLAAIQTAQPGVSKIFVEVAEAPSVQDEVTQDIPAAQGERVAGSHGRGDPMATIMIPKQESAGGKDDVAVSVNGFAWGLKRGVDLTVPWRVVVALGYTEQDLITHTDEGDVLIDKSQRIPFNLMDRPSREEIADWFEKTKDAFCP
tara:strand:+ start:60 stop:605 length:546 start_codon:yes stop_codon:yes gene_type:complete